MKTILVGVDGSDNGNRAVVAAADMAARLGARLILAMVRPRELSEELRHYGESEHITGTPARMLEQIVGQILEAAARLATENGAQDVERKVLDGDPARELLALARERNVDLIAVGSRGLGRLKELLLGSVSHKLMSLAECPCMVVK